MIVDTSAIMAALLGEPEGAGFIRLIQAAEDVRLSAGSYIELAVTATRRERPISLRIVDEFLAAGGVTIEPVTVEQAYLGRQAYLVYGRGRHPAALNFGDCFAYALAKATDKPLLFKGEDFAKTDVRSAAS